MAWRHTLHIVHHLLRPPCGAARTASDPYSNAQSPERAGPTTHGSLGTNADLEANTLAWRIGHEGGVSAALVLIHHVIAAELRLNLVDGGAAIYISFNIAVLGVADTVTDDGACGGTYCGGGDATGTPTHLAAQESTRNTTEHGAGIVSGCRGHDTLSLAHLAGNGDLFVARGGTQDFVSSTRWFNF